MASPAGFEPSWSFPEPDQEGTPARGHVGTIPGEPLGERLLSCSEYARQSQGLESREEFRAPGLFSNRLAGTVTSDSKSKHLPCTAVAKSNPPDRRAGRMKGLISSSKTQASPSEPGGDRQQRRA